METRTRIWSVAASVVALTLVFTCGAAFFFWKRLPSDEQLFLILFFKTNFIYFFSFTFLLLIGLGLLLDGIILIYVLPINRLIEETTLISSVNPAHRIKPDGSPDVKLLAEVINNWADKHQRLQTNIRQEIRESKAEVEREKNILTALMADFREGVMVCNTEGRILLYNRKAVRFFSRATPDAFRSGDRARHQGRPNSDPLDNVIGLGRTIFRIIDKNLIVHALDELAEKLHNEASSVIAYFMAVSHQDTLLRVEVTPVLNRDRKLTGMILVLNDISAQLEQDQHIARLVQALLKGFRASLSSIRSAIETVMAYPEMADDQRDRFQKIIHEESMTLGQLVERVSDEYTQKSISQWPRICMRTEDLIDTVCRRARAMLDVIIQVEGTSAGDTRWVKVDSYSIILAILFCVKRLKERTDNAALSIRLGRQGRFTAIDLVWPGDPIRIEILRQWEGEPLEVGAGGLALTLTLREVIDHHEADLWSSNSRHRPGSAYLRLLLLSSDEATEPDVDREITIVTDEVRPVFYDFDLFKQAGLTIELGERRLTELTYTVFDLETTGLDPRGGDEIISLGAVRIVNGRLLSEEQFNQLIDPQCILSRESVRIHGIRPEMLKDQPTIDKALPLFHRYCEDTVLVAHNAAFDMLMLKLKEKASGVRFSQPILDTLLLSDGLHPSHRTHEIEKIAQRLGVRVIGRHTALGDALTTAEILLKMIPLLEGKGIHTLNDAIAFSKGSHYARLKY
jgi:DNA polymerase-3 subunit epsilon